MHVRWSMPFVSTTSSADHGGDVVVEVGSRRRTMVNAEVRDDSDVDVDGDQTQAASPGAARPRGTTEAHRKAHRRL